MRPGMRPLWGEGAEVRAGWWGTRGEAWAPQPEVPSAQLRPCPSSVPRGAFFEKSCTDFPRGCGVRGWVRAREGQPGHSGLVETS